MSDKQITRIEQNRKCCVTQQQIYSNKSENGVSSLFVDEAQFRHLH